MNGRKTLSLRHIKLLVIEREALRGGISQQHVAWLSSGPHRVLQVLSVYLRHVV